MRTCFCCRSTFAVGYLLFFALLMAAGAAQAESLSGPTLVTALRAGGYVILMRHTSSPRTEPSASEANVDNPHHERQLDDVGRSSARNLGEALRRLRIPIGPLLSSPTYRALETIRLAGLGTPATLDALGDSGHSMQPDSTGERGAWLRAKISESPPTGKDTLIVTHLPNIAEVFPEEAAGFADGEALILRPDGHGGAQIIGHVKIDEWAGLDSPH